MLTFTLVLRHIVSQLPRDARYGGLSPGVYAVSGGGQRPELLANWLLTGVSIYLACGLVFAVLFLIFGIKRMDATSIGAPLSFKLTILPGLVVLWPFLMIRWFSRGHE